MMRVVLVVVAVFVAVLAFFFEQPWLYAVAGLSLVGVLVLLGRRLWNLSGRRSRSAPNVTPPDSSLDELGIADVRPHDGDAGGDGAAGASTGTPEPQSRSSDSPRVSEQNATDPEVHDEPAGGRAETEAEGPSHEEVVDGPDRPRIDPLLESLRATLDADTACLLVQDDVVLEYRIDGMASVHTGVQKSGTFETDAPLLTATMSRKSVTVQELDSAGTSDDAFYETTPSVQQRAFIPVPRPDSASTVFLLVDSSGDSDLSSSHARRVLQQYMETIRLLRAPDRGDDSHLLAESSPETSEAVETANEPVDGRPEPRPRREIIREEMQAADVGDDDLALVLVHLNRAESIARQGEEAVGSAERRLRTRLEHFAAGQRVERFGELTYGIFPRHDVHEVESWAAELQDVMAQETGELEGGVSVGVAVRRPRHDAEGLRADATEALREAYETGTCTVVA